MNSAADTQLNPSGGMDPIDFLRATMTGLHSLCS
jgi:hypothetical protein